MLRKLAAAGLAFAVLGALAWRGVVSEYFGRGDPRQWERDHPAPPPPPVELGRHRVTLRNTRRIVPSVGLPTAITLQIANNNLDVIRHGDGRVYLAWRSAPSHFAGSSTVVHVVSSVDEVTWRFEANVETGRDLREPRFLSLGERLFLYVARLGDDPFAFEPEGVSVSERVNGRFQPLEPVYKPGYIVWRVKRVGDEVVIVAYGGGAGLYSYGENALSVELLTTNDGRSFAPLDPKRPFVTRGGGSEADFAIAGDGSLFAVVRNEAGDASGWGSKLCRAPASSLSEWTCRSDPKKYDSPLAFEHDGEIYVVARRNRTEDGHYDVGRGPRAFRTLTNELRYIRTAKRCSLFRFDARENRLAFVLDLPSRGDTCFPSMLRGQNPEEVVIYDYSSDIHGPDLPWAAGQRQPTFIYRHVLAFERR